MWLSYYLSLQEHPEWEIKNGSVFFQKAKESAPCKEIPSLQLINQTLSYARELERIVWEEMQWRLLFPKFLGVWIIVANTVFWNCSFLIQCETIKLFTSVFWSFRWQYGCLYFIFLDLCSGKRKTLPYLSTFLCWGLYDSWSCSLNFKPIERFISNYGDIISGILHFFDRTFFFVNDHLWKFRMVVCSAGAYCFSKS